MSLPVKDIGLYVGQDKTIPISVADSSGTVNITNDTLYFYVRAVVGGDAVITKDSDTVTEIEFTDAENGAAAIYLVPADTTSLDTGKYTYELWRTDDSAKTKPILTGYFWIYSIAPSMINAMRELLTEAGELHILKVIDETVNPATLSVLYTSRRRLTGVEGVWLLTDDTHSGTNYYTGGGFDADSGKIWLGTPLTSLINRVRVSYTWESGITDGAINWHLWASRNYTISYTGIDFSYGAETTTVGLGAEGMSFSRAMIGCILSVNGANVAQMGYNFRIDEFEIQTKLWGEGMIAEALFTQYRMQYEEWKMALGKKGYSVVATPETRKYDLESLVGWTDSASEGGEGF